MWSLMRCKVEYGWGQSELCRCSGKPVQEDDMKEQGRRHTIQKRLVLGEYPAVACRRSRRVSRP